jgi:hypothetical protein
MSPLVHFPPLDEILLSICFSGSPLMIFILKSESDIPFSFCIRQRVNAYVCVCVCMHTRA